MAALKSEFLAQFYATHKGAPALAPLRIGTPPQSRRFGISALDPERPAGFRPLALGLDLKLGIARERPSASLRARLVDSLVRTKARSPWNSRPASPVFRRIHSRRSPNLRSVGRPSSCSIGPVGASASK